MSCSTAVGAVRACDAQARALCLALQGDALVVYEKSESVIGAVIELNAKEIRPKIPVTVRPPARPPPPRAVRSSHARILNVDRGLCSAGLLSIAPHGPLRFSVIPTNYPWACFVSDGAGRSGCGHCQHRAARGWPRIAVVATCVQIIRTGAIGESCTHNYRDNPYPCSDYPCHRKAQRAVMDSDGCLCPARPSPLVRTQP